MNRRQLLAWLSALPFMPAALSKRLQPYTMVCATFGHGQVGVMSKEAEITFPTPSSNWGEICYIYCSTFNTNSFIDMKYKPNLPDWW